MDNKKVVDLKSKVQGATEVKDPKTQLYPGSMMTIESINEMGSKMEKVILEGLPATKLFSDAEIVMLQFVGAMICGSLRQPQAIKIHIDAFCNELKGYADTWLKLDAKNQSPLIKPQ